MSTPPVNLCAYKLSPDKSCRQISLKGDNYCRHHRRFLRQTEAKAAMMQFIQQPAITFLKTI